METKTHRSDRRLQFSLATFLMVVLFAAIAFAALRGPSRRLWAGASFTFTVIVLLIGIVGLTVRRGESRAFWLGFSVLGWSYAIFAFAPWFDENVAPRMLGTPLANYLEEEFRIGAFRIGAPEYIYLGMTPQGARTSTTPLQQICDSWSAILAALLGGVAGRRFYPTCEESPDQ